MYYLQHATSPKNLDDILKNGLRFNTKSKKFADDGSRFIWFDFIAIEGDEKIIYSNTAIGTVSTDLIFVLDYEKIIKFLNTHPELNINFSKDYVKFTDEPEYIDPYQEDRLEEVIEVVLETYKTEPQTFDIKPFLRYVYTCGEYAVQIKEILKNNSLENIKVYKVDKTAILENKVREILKRDDKISRNFINKFITDDTLSFRLKKLLCYQLFFMTGCLSE